MDLPAEMVGVPQADAVEEARSTLSTPLPEEQKQSGIWLQKLLAPLPARSRARRYLAGAAVGSAALYVFQKFQVGPIALLSIPLEGLVVLGAFTGSVVFRGAATVAGAIWDALAIPHLWRRGGLWFTFRLGRISPKQYFELGALADYQHHCRHLPPDTLPPQAKFVRDAVRWRQGCMGQKAGSRKSRRKQGDIEGKYSD